MTNPEETNHDMTPDDKSPILPDHLAQLIRKLRIRYGRIEPPYALPHTFHKQLAISPLDFMSRLRKKEPRSLQTYLQRCEEAQPPAVHGAKDADDTTTLAHLLGGAWQADSWTWHLCVPSLLPLHPETKAIAGCTSTARATPSTPISSTGLNTPPSLSLTMS